MKAKISQATDAFSSISGQDDKFVSNMKTLIEAKTGEVDRYIKLKDNIEAEHKKAVAFFGSKESDSTASVEGFLPHFKEFIQNLCKVLPKDIQKTMASKLQKQLSQTAMEADVELAPIKEETKADIRSTMQPPSMAEMLLEAERKRKAKAAGGGGMTAAQRHREKLAKEKEALANSVDKEGTEGFDLPLKSED